MAKSKKLTTYLYYLRQKFLKTPVLNCTRKSLVIFTFYYLLLPLQLLPFPVSCYFLKALIFYSQI